MSSKWRALQHRHRYTYSSVVFPKPFTETLDRVPSEISSSFQFFPQLTELSSLNSTYSQITAAKSLSSSFTQLLSAQEVPSEIVSIASKLYLEILFLENSHPLHRTLISALTKNRKFLPLISSCFESLCEEYRDLEKKGLKRFLVSRAVLSLMGYPKLGFINEMVEKCSVLVADDIVSGLKGVVSDVEGGSHPSPVVMEQCQEAMSCLYYLLQRFPTKFAGLEEGLNTFESVVRTILSVLRSSAFSRDCLVAAGVSFCAAIQTHMSTGELASFISKGLFEFGGEDGENGDVDVKKWMPGGGLYLEIKGFSVLSRLCLVRGVLTAVPRTVLNTPFVKKTDGSNWTILYDGILPELCKYCENPTDSHFNFHALTVTQIGLQQIKTSILADLTDFSGGYDPLCEEMMSRILRIIWNNLEDPLNQTVKQVHLIFDLLMDIEASVPSGEGNERAKLFLFKIASDLLRLGPRCKGRYVPLASLIRRLGAKSILGLNPNLLYETIYAYVDDDVCCSVTSFLKCFLECLRDECWSSDGVEKGYESFRGHCLPPLLHGLVSGHSKLRSNLNTYALPVVLEIDSDSIFQMLAFISVGPSREERQFTSDLKIEQCVAALVSLLKVSRMLQLIEGDIDLDHHSMDQDKSCNQVALVCVKGSNVRVLVEWFILALTHADESLRIDAAESLFLNPKTASLPSFLELNLLREAVPLNMRCCSTAFQMKWTSLFRKFFSRVKTALERQMKQGSWQPVSCNGSSVTVHGNNGMDEVVRRAVGLFQFMKWFSCFLLHSCYPSAPYERKTMAMELILIMLDTWPASPPQDKHSFYPYGEGFTSPESTLCLVGSIIDSWDRLRESSFRILLCFPTPLPGINSHDSVKEVIQWAKKLVCSPRVRESDAGALAFRLIFRKYVLELQWVVGVSDNVVSLNSQSQLVSRDAQVAKFRSPLVEYILSLIEWLRELVEEGESDLSEACRTSFVHGVLLTLRYTFEELDWNTNVVLSSSSEMRCLLQKLLELVMRVTSLALCVVSADAWHMSYDNDDALDDSSFLTDLPLEMDMPESLSEPAEKSLKPEDDVRPAEQAIMVGCWLAMKEISLLLGTIIRKIPLPSCTISESSKGSATEEMIFEPDGMLDLGQLETIGSHFLQVLLKMKHNGAIDKTRAGFTALCNRLLCSNDPRLCKMTESWMEQLMDRTIAKGQTVDDLLRRSAGIPAAFIAFFLSEPEGIPKKLLPRALRWLIDVASMSLHNVCEGDNSQREMLHDNFIQNQPSKTTVLEAQANGKASKIRDEGVIPTVHAFNVLKAAFNDANLATDTSGFCAEALIIAIRSFSSPYWEVRNSACLAYTALIRRMIGFLNIQKRESARRAFTGLDFFHRFPALHPFLFSELKIATELLGDGCSIHAESNIVKSIHPSLCPILILLSRLKPSLISSDTEDALDPILFLPFIRKCGTQSNLRVRLLASRALIGLVSNERLQDVLNGVAQGLPCDRSISANMSSRKEAISSSSLSFNAIHGVLLQLSSLLVNNCRDLPDATKKDQVLSELIYILSNRSWIGSTKSCPCPTLNSSFLLVIDHMLGIARTLATSKSMSFIQNLLLDLSSKGLEMERSSVLAWHDPTLVELRTRVATSYFGCLFGGNSESAEGFQLLASISGTSNLLQMPESEISIVGLQEKIKSCIFDSSYEVRVGVLKRLFQLVKSMKSGGKKGVITLWAENYLQATMMTLLPSEENPKCIYYILKIIFSWCILQFETTRVEIDLESVLSFWNRLVLLNKSATQSKTREILVCCMAISVKHFVILLQSSNLIDQSGIVKFSNKEELVEVLKCISYFILLVKQFSLPSMTVNMRKAAAEAIVASGLLSEASSIASVVSNSHNSSKVVHIDHIEKLETSNFEISEAVNFYAGRILDSWFTCLQLLEDEDAGLRQRLADDIQKCIVSKGSNGSHCSDGVPSQVDRVIESSFGFLSAGFGHWIEYLNYLCTYVLAAGSAVTSQEDLVRRIFDKEIDNHHEEKLLICQICCSHLEKLSAPNSWPRLDRSSENDVEILLKRWRQKFLQQIVSFSNDCLQSQKAADWIGGIGNHKDAFTSVYVNLLGLYVLTQNHSSEPLTDGVKVYLSEFAELRKNIRPFLRNPLISNMYFLVIKAHEEMFGFLVDLEHRQECLVWEGFNPYFLLR